MNMKKNLALATALGLALSFTGCTSPLSHPAGTAASGAAGGASGKAGMPSEKVEISLALAAYEPEVPGWNAVVEAANKKLEGRNIVIRVNKIPTSTWEPYYQKILTLMAAGSPPDIGRIAESYLPVLIQKDRIVDLTDKIGEIDRSQYVDGAFKGAANPSGRTFGVPCGIYTMLLYYNKDLFDQAGLSYPSGDWEHPMTWREFRTTALTLTRGDGADKIYGAHLNLGLLMLNQYFVSNSGKPLYDDAGNCTLSDAHNMEIFDLFGKMYVEDKSLMRPVDAKTVGYQDMFRAGKVAMMAEGTWFHYSARKIAAFRPGIAAIPSNMGKSATTGFIDSWVIYKGTSHEAEAWEALKAIISKEAFDALAPYGVGGIPAAKSTLRMKDQLVGGRFDAADKDIFIESIRHMVGASYSVDINEHTQDWNYILEQFASGKLTTDEFIARESETISKKN
jgi:ABC-type glycerol-3-phosphate transport system substrate-binding protein